MYKILSSIILIFWLSMSFGQNVFPYDLKKPTKTIELPKELEEISGIGMYEQQKYIWAVQDEEGKLFKVDIETGDVLASIPFWKDGDYEGIEAVDGTIYVLKSTGTIYKVQLLKDDEVKVDKYNGFLEGKDDAEGLAYDAQYQRLLIACKKNDDERSKVYGFDLTTEKFIKNEVYHIKNKEVIKFLKNHPDLRKLEKLKEMFDKNDFDFAPSAIAVHPHTQEVYILSSQGKTLFVLHSNGDIAHIEKMSKEVHAQPEGLCFDQNGNLYISNEGKGGVAKIYRFDKSK